MSEAQVGIRILLEDGASAGLGTLKGALGGLANNASALDNAFKHMGPAAQAAGVIAAGSGLVFLGFSTALHSVIDNAMDLQVSLSHVKTAVQGASDVMPGLTGRIVDLANHSVFTSKDIADAFVSLGQKGFTAGEILANDGELGRAVVDLAEATNTKAVPAADLLGATLRAFGGDAKDSAHFADVLTAAFYNGIGTAAGLQQAFSQVSGRAHEVGWNVTDTAVALDILTRRLHSGSQAGTALQYMIASLTNPTAGAQKELASLGIITLNNTVPAFKDLEAAYLKTGSAAGKNNITYDGTITSLKGQYDAAQKMGLLHTDQTFYQWAVKNGVLNDSLYDSTGKFKNLTGVVDTLGAAIKGKPEQMDALIGALGGARSGKAFASLLSNVGSTDAEMKNLYARFADTSATQKAATNLDNLRSTLTKLGTTFTDLQALIGLPMLKPLQEWGDKLNNLISGIETANPALLSLAGQFLVIGTAVSGVIFFVSSFVFIALTIGNVALVISGVALVVFGLAVAATAIYDNWSKVKVVFQPLIDIFKEIWGVLVTLGGVVKDIALNAFGHLRDAAGFIKDHFGALNPVFGGIKSGLAGVSESIKRLEPHILAGMDAAARGLGNAAIWVHDHWHLLTPVFHAVGSAMEYVRGVVGTLLGLAWEGIVAGVHALGNAAIFVHDHWSLLTPVFHTVGAAFEHVKGIIASIGTAALHELAEVLQKVGHAALFLHTQFLKLGGFAGPLGGVLKGILLSVLPLGGGFLLLHGHIGQIFGGLKGLFEMVGGGAKWFDALLMSVVRFGGGLMRGAGLILSVLPSFGGIGAALGGIADTLLVGFLPAMLKIGPSVLSLGGEIKSFVSLLIGALPTMGALFSAMVPPLLAEAGAAILAMAPWIVAGVTLAAAVVGLVMLIQHFNLMPKILSMAGAAWSMIVKEFQDLVKVIGGEVMGALKQLQPAWLQLVSAFTALRPVLIFLGAILLGVIGMAFTTLLGIIMGFIRGLGGVIHMVVSVVVGIIQIFSGLVTFYAGLFLLIKDIFTGNWGAILGDLKKMGSGVIMIFTGLWTIISGLVGGFFQTIGGLLSGFIGAFIGMFKHLADMLVGHSIVPEMLTALFTWFEKLPGRVGAAVLGMVTGVLSLFGHLKDLALAGVGVLASLLMGVFTSLATTVPARVGGMVVGIISLIASLPSRILSALGNVGGMLLQAGQHIIQGLITGILSQIGNLTGAAGKVAQGIANIFQHHSPPKTGPLQTDDQWMHHMMLMHAAQITSDAPLLANAATLAARGISSAFSSPSQLALAGGGARGGAGAGAAGAGKEIHVHNYIDSKEVSTLTLDMLTGQLRMNGMTRLNR